MHELALCQGLLDQVGHVAVAQRADAVTRIVVRVGPLSGVEPPLLESAFTLARAGTVAAQAALEIEFTAVRVACLECGAECEVAANRLVCAACHSYRTRLVEGDEMQLVRVELNRTDGGNAPCEPQPSEAADHV